jgi:outer membrane scaffolding protein for murein synthesis (MipA/OmpV family)
MHILVRLCQATALFGGLSLGAPLLAQEPRPQLPVEESAMASDFVTIGLAGAISPSYEGSDNYNISPIPLILGRVGGVTLQPRGPGFAADVIADRRGEKISLIAGPVATFNFDRVNRIGDSVVETLGELDLALEVGAVAGITVHRVLHKYDSLTLQSDIRWDILGAHEGMVVAPSLTYFSPLNKAAAVSVSLAGELVDDRYADYYFSIDAAGAAASGLPIFTAQGGLKNLSATMLSGIDLDGDMTNGGLGLFVIGSYSRLVGDAKRSPVTAIRGSADQFFGSIGLGYTF